MDWYKGTYDVLIFLGIVGYLGDGDGTANVLAVGSLTYGETVSAARITHEDSSGFLQT